MGLTTKGRKLVRKHSNKGFQFFDADPMLYALKKEKRNYLFSPYRVEIAMEICRKVGKLLKTQIAAFKEREGVQFRPRFEDVTATFSKTFQHIYSSLSILDNVRSEERRVGRV